MTAPMVVIELVLMGAMYGSRKMNMAIMTVAIVAVSVFWIFITEQVAIIDRQFLRSMIPHHAGAILMCEKAPIRAPDIKDLCAAIVSSQQSEIDQMKGKLTELER